MSKSAWAWAWRSSKVLSKNPTISLAILFTPGNIARGNIKLTTKLVKPHANSSNILVSETPSIDSALSAPDIKSAI